MDNAEVCTGKKPDTKDCGFHESIEILVRDRTLSGCQG